MIMLLPTHIRPIDNEKGDGKGFYLTGSSCILRRPQWMVWAGAATHLKEKVSF